MSASVGLQVASRSRLNRFSTAGKTVFSRNYNAEEICKYFSNWSNKAREIKEKGLCSLSKGRKTTTLTAQCVAPDQ